MRTWGIWAAVAIIPVLGGCATVNNVGSSNPNPLVYGGVRQEWSELKAWPRDDPSHPYMAAVYLVQKDDLCLSVVGDTLTLPYVLVRQAISAVAGSGRPAEMPPTTAVEPVR
jgi:uncharacterized protein YceK